MASEALARRYGEAYFEVARHGGHVEAWRQDLARAVEMVQHPAVAEAMRNPRVSINERVRLVMDLLDGLEEPTRNLVRLLIERGRTTLLGDALDHYNQLADRESGVTRVEVVTAVPVDERLERSISTSLGERLGGRIETTIRQDPTILGGLVIRVGDRVIDGSLRTRLQQLQAALA